AERYGDLLNDEYSIGRAYIFKNNGSDNWTQADELGAPDKDNNDYFGESVSISGNYVIVGAFSEDSDENENNELINSGSAYIFKNDGSDNWNFVKKLVASDRADNDYFGNSVAISGDYAIIGANEKDGTDYTNIGGAYIFKNDGLDNWSEFQKITAPKQYVNDEFGSDVAIDGDLLIISAIGEDNNANDDDLGSVSQAGSAYIYRFNGSDTWDFMQKIVASDRDRSDEFGTSVSISGKSIIVGAENEDENADGGQTLSNTGSVYLFNLLTDPIYVNANASGNNDGSSWSNAYTSLHSALDAATSIDQIWIAKGTYYPMKESDGATNWSRNYTFSIPNGTELYGGFSGSETTIDDRTDYGSGGANETILHGDLNNDDAIVDGDTLNRLDNVYNVVTDANGNVLSDFSSLDGITLKGGYPIKRIFIDKSATGSENGTTWENAFVSLQSALEDASYGDEIWVAKGTYYPSKEEDGTTDTQRKYCFKMINGVKIYGGFAGTETSVADRTDFGYGGANETILSGDHNGDDEITGIGSTLSFSNNSDNSYHVVYHPEGYTLTNSALLDGFTITGGNANGSSNPWNDGAGIYNLDGASPTIKNCYIFGNRASDNSGGIYNVNGSTAVITNCTITRNYSTDRGGGMGNFDGANTTITNCLIWGNHAHEFGGGIWNDGSSPTLTNCTIADNYSHSSGGGIYNDNNSNPVIVNTILWGNVNNSGFGPQIRNYTKSDMELSYSCVEGGIAGGIASADGGSTTDNGGNIESDPLFDGSGDHPYLITSSSPCIDAGDNSVNSEEGDIRGSDYPRGVDASNRTGGSIDIGAYEYQYENDPLPVELATFTASVSANLVSLKWQTATELNNYGFEIQRSKFTEFIQVNDASTSSASGWENIGFVEGHGTTNSPQSYSFVDTKTFEVFANLKGFNGAIQYRLKQIDFDGKYEYSDVVEVTFGTPDNFELMQNYPNPFNPSTTIKFNIPVTTDYQSAQTTLRIFNVLGEQVAELLNAQLEPGLHIIEFDASRLASGIYFYKLTSGEFNQIRKMILMK
ncbi:MAG: T9SS type A sorting domain-containing protein, partial [Melioribacteraceae bacterium]|nr:T9SS type A sorting domain-containing protein [Melioribacteraceae bacterium]